VALCGRTRNDDLAPAISSSTCPELVQGRNRRFNRLSAHLQIALFTSGG
jgi:hypothetical protein